jgi:hypothetical protein
MHTFQALGVFEEVKQLRLSHLGMESSLVIQTMLRIGNIQLARGEAHLALNCFNEIVGIGYASDSINGIAIANAFYGKGCAQFCLFQLSDAMKSLNESLNWKLAALGEDNSGLACIFYQSESCSLLDPSGYRNILTQIFHSCQRFSGSRSSRAIRKGGCNTLL